MRDNPLAMEITFYNLLRFAAPTIAMLLFRALYTIVDGFFVARYVGSAQLAAISIFYPVLSVMFALSSMLALGGSVVVSRQLGEGDEPAARGNFSMVVCIGALVGVAAFVLGAMFVNPILYFMGAKPDILAYCREYMLSLMPFMPMLVLLMIFQAFFVASGRPLLGMWCNVAGGVANIILDYVFIALMGMGLFGAGCATGIGYSLPAVLGFAFFAGRGRGALYLVKPNFRHKSRILAEICVNGSPEFISNISEALTTLLFNITVIKYFGGHGAAALIIILYVQFFFAALFYGYSDGVVPLVSYNYGNRNTAKLRRLLSCSLKFVIASSAFLFALSMLLPEMIISAFASSETGVFKIAAKGLSLFSFAFVVGGSYLFIACFFSALSNGRAGAVISILRSLVLPSLLIITLPLVWGAAAVWLAVPIAETIVALVSGLMLRVYKKRYNY